MGNEVSLKEIVGRGYSEFWHYKGRYCVCKGSRASKKSKTTALWHIYHMMKYPLSNTLVVRKTERTLKDSCFSDLRWAIHRLGVDHLWRATVSPLALTYLPTGQKILFRGYDDPFKITSISVDKGVLNFVWIEEAYEIGNESDFQTLTESIRGELPEGYFKRFTITFNPWSEHHWLKSRFFDTPYDNVLAMTTNYTCNEWLDDSDREMYEELKTRNPGRYRVAGLGEWGISEGLIYDKWQELAFNIDELRKRTGAISFFGMDFGYTIDPTALVCGIIFPDSYEMYIFDELYEKGLTNKDIAERVINMGYSKEIIYCDCAEPKSIDELYDAGLSRVRPAIKGPDSIRHGIQFIQNFKMYIHPRCVNFLTEVSCYTWDKDKLTGKFINKPIDDYNHACDALRYGLSQMIAGNAFDLD